MTNTKSFTLIGAAGLLSACLLTACGSIGERHGLDIQLSGDTLATIWVEKPLKYLLLPIEEGAAEGKVRLDTGSPADVDMDVRLARSKVDYFVPFTIILFLLVFRREVRRQFKCGVFLRAAFAGRNCSCPIRLMPRIANPSVRSITIHLLTAG